MKLMSGMQEQFEAGKPLEMNPIGVLLPESFEEARLLCSVVPRFVDVASSVLLIDIFTLYEKASNAASQAEMRDLILKADDLLVNQGKRYTDGSHNWGLREFLDIPPAGNWDGIRGSIVDDSEI